MTDLTGLGLHPPTMRILCVLVLLGALSLASSFKCPRVSNQALIQDPKDCRKYYHCLTDGRFFIKSCPNGLVFEPKTKVCVWDSFRSCIPEILEDEKDNVIIPVAMKAVTSTDKDTTVTEKQTTTTTTKATTSASKSTESEKSEETTTVNFSTETSSENVTVSANTTDMRAGKNPTDGDNSTAATTDKNTSPESFKTSKKEHTIVKRSPFEDNTINSEGTKIECRHAFAYVADPNNCHTFYHCNNWRPFQKRCPPGLFFDSKHLICNWPHNVNCIEGYRAKTYFGLKRRMYPQNTIKKVKTIVESTTEKIPFLETIENDVKKIRYEEDTDSTTSQATRRVTARSFGRWKKRTFAPETSSVYETTQEQTTAEPTTESTVAPSTSTDSLMFETHPSESRSTWHGWNFDLFYTGNERHRTDLDKLEVFSNGKKVQSEKPSDANNAVSESTTLAASPVSTESASSQEETSTTAENSSVADVSNATEVPSTESTAADTTEATDDSSTSDRTTDDVTTATPEETSASGSTRTSSFDFGSDEDRKLSHPRKLDHEVPPSNPFLTSDRIAANQQSMYARDYHSVEDVEIEKFMMKMLNDAMQSKHMVARDTSDDNLVDESYDKSKKEVKPEIGGSDVVDKWEIADREGKRAKGTLIEEVTEAVVDEVESSGDAEESFDNEPHMTNLIMRDEGKPSEEKTTTTAAPIIETSKTENKTETENVTETVTADESSDNATVTVDSTTDSSNVTTTTTAQTTTTSAASTTTTESGNTTTAEVSTTTTAATTAAAEKKTENTTEPVISESTTVKAVPLLKDLSDLCTDNNCTIKSDNGTETTTTTVAPSSTTTTTTNASSTETTTVLKKEVTTAVTTETNTTAAAETTTTAQATNATETVTSKTESVETSSPTEKVTKTQPSTTIAISKDAAGKVVGDFKASADNAISKDDKKSENSAPQPVNTTKTEETTTIPESKPENVTESTNVTSISDEMETVTNATKIEKELNTTITSTVNSVSQTNVTSESSEEGSSEEEAEDSSEVTEVTSSSTITSVVMETSPSNGKTLTGGKGTTKKSFISLSDLIKWYLRHWRHYSRWRDSKEIKSVEE